ncbi:polysaccharide biosynthesis tyrosine autokinase [Massilia sp. TWP1-3-3]|uniref:polysaccharide biosynthesis tyrosine autokinase n=1 Tax=Massilia sp. TWP1-3-3 TaxID=2804573 RepID=UPI003CF016F8
MTHSELSIAAAEQQRRAESRIGALLLAAGKITPEHAERVLRMQDELGIRFGEAAQRLGLVDDDDIDQVLARQFDYPYVQPGQGGCSPYLVAACDPFGAQAETLRAVRSQLLLRWFARGHKSLVVAGVGQGDGASLFAANLAVAFAQLGRRTLLVDADLRHPSQQAIFNTGARQGLADMLAGRIESDLTEPLASFGTLSLLGAGTLPPNPQELLSRPAMTSLNAAFEARHDVVLYDVTPSARALDALLLAARTGAVLIVARKHRTHLDQLHALADKVGQNGAKVLGAVLVEFP